MFFSTPKRSSAKWMLSNLIVFGCLTTAWGQTNCTPKCGSYGTPQIVPRYQTQPTPHQPMDPGAVSPMPPVEPMPPDTTPDTSPMPDPLPSPATAPAFDQSAFASGFGQGAAGLPSMIAGSAGGYIDNAIPRTRFTFRFDAAYNNPTPDRAEFFYAKCGCFRGLDPSAPGPVPTNPVGGRLVETSVDYQELWFNMEYAFLENRASAFVELPVRFINPEVNDNEAGLGDINFGMKYALIAEPDHYFTVQLRVYSPTGDAGDGLGTDHFSIEPALLYLRQVNHDWSVFGELRDWISVNGTDGPIAPGGGGQDYDSNVLRYGVGVAYNLIDNPCQGYRVAPVVEIVGWHVFDGFASSSPDGTPANIMVETADASIVNAKIGMRITFGDSSATNPAGYGGDQSLYVGWGHALTNEDDVWYEDVLRVEYRVNF